jgi:seryl-tRNA synthetase
MYDIKWIRENPEAFDRGLKRRGLAPLSQHLISIDQHRRAITRVLESWQARRKVASEKIRQVMAVKDAAAEQELRAEVAECKTSISTLEGEQREIEERLKKELAEIPNTPLDDVPDGTNASGNVEHHQFGNKRNHAFKPKQHFELGEALGMMDFELAAKISGARFVVLQKGLARMERALGQFMLDVHTSEKHGYTEVDPPLLVHDDVMFGTAQLPKFRDDQFFALSFKYTENQEEIAERINLLIRDTAAIRAQTLDLFKKQISKITGALPHFVSEEVLTEAVGRVLDDLLKRYEESQRKIVELERDLGNYVTLFDEKRWLIPTAEVPLTNLVRESIVDEDTLPRRYTACTPCFRAEAGAAGKDTRGMIRQHQFTKVELVSITTPEKSKEEHERMLACAEEVLKQLDLHYRVVTLCTGDMGFAAQKTYDIEVWLPGQGQYREISSCSNCGEFQARRMDARYKGKDGRVKGHVHTLNGSGVAVGRALIAVMETYQQDDGSIMVPEALKPYMGGMSKIERA